LGRGVPLGMRKVGRASLRRGLRWRDCAPGELKERVCSRLQFVDQLYHCFDECLVVKSLVGNSSSFL